MPLPPGVSSESAPPSLPASYPTSCSALPRAGTPGKRKPTPIISEHLESTVLRLGNLTGTGLQDPEDKAAAALTSLRPASSRDAQKAPAVSTRLPG